jgi:predicted enzyme related to lactoylglutathione lyase
MCSIHVKDPAAAFEFYTQTLGFVELMAMPEHNLFIVRAANEEDGVGLLLEPSHNPIGADYMNRLYASAIPAIVFGVDDVQAEFERLRELGVEFRGEPTTDPSGTIATFDDGCGNFVRLHQD